MWNLIIILVASLVLSSSYRIDRNKTPVMIFSNKLTFNKKYSVTTYEGRVIIEFADYVIHTEKFVSASYKKDKKLYLESVEFPSRTKAVKRDQKEIIIMPNAVFDGQAGVIRSKGEIIVEKDGQLYKTSEVEIELGNAQKVSFPKF